MTKKDLDKRVKEILESSVSEGLLENRILLNTEDLSRVLNLTLRDVQEKYGMYSLYTLEVVKASNSLDTEPDWYSLKFPCGSVVKIKRGL